jgi:hypothetical protein
MTSSENRTSEKEDTAMSENRNPLNDDVQHRPTNDPCIERYGPYEHLVTSHGYGPRGPVIRLKGWPFLDEDLYPDGWPSDHLGLIAELSPTTALDLVHDLLKDVNRPLRPRPVTWRAERWPTIGRVE